MVYRSKQKDIELPIVFHHHKEALERAVKLPHNTEAKAVAYELYDYGDYFIIKDIMMQCKTSGKTLVIEDLNFENKKDKQLYENKRSNEMLSSFAYAKIVEKIERKACYEGVEVMKVDPAYTS